MTEMSSASALNNQINQVSVITCSPVLPASLDHTYQFSPNSDRLIRQYFPKGTYFKNLSKNGIRFVENRLNIKPRKCLGFKQPMVILKITVALDT
jgi:IS30 family transposase